MLIRMLAIDEEIKNILQEGSELFKNNMNQVLEILRCNYE